MIVRLVGQAPPEILSASDLGALHVVLVDGATPGGIGPLGRPDDDGEHVWLDISALRAAADPGDDAPEWGEQFAGMVAYAHSKGWTDADGSHLRAHVEHEG
jgi:hypothetical protein